MAARASGTSLWPLYALLGVGSIILIVLGAMNTPTPWGPAALFSGVVGVIITLATAGVAFRSGSPLQGGGSQTGPTTESNASPAIDPARLESLEQAVTELREAFCLSDEARRALFSGSEADAIRAMIGRAAARGDVDEIARLAHAAEHALGLPEVAAAGKALIAQVEAREEEVRVRPLLETFDAALARRDWAAAYQAAGSIRQAAPRAEATGMLERRIEQARESHKQSLEQRFLEAANRDAIDEAMALLRELDRYMRRDEASRLGQVAQTVISRHRDRVGLAFQIAVQERRWHDAARHGNIIVEQYPNTKMAEQVRSMIDVIRTRATQAAVAVSTRG